jgi:hypothetical protein
MSESHCTQRAHTGTGRHRIGGEVEGHSRSVPVHIFPALPEILPHNGFLCMSPVVAVGLRDEPSCGFCLV